MQQRRHQRDQRGRIVVELQRGAEFARRFEVELRGSDLYSGLVALGKGRNHMKVSLHRSGAAHAYVRSARTSAASGPSLGALTEPLVISSVALSSAEELKWRGESAKTTRNQVVVIIDIEANPRPWATVIVIPRGWSEEAVSLASRGVDSRTLLLAQASADWTDPQVLVAVYAIAPDALETMTSQILEMGDERTAPSGMVRGGIPGIASWTGMPC